MDSPFKPLSGQRWLPFKNVGKLPIPPFAVMAIVSDGKEGFRTPSGGTPPGGDGTEEHNGSYVIRCDRPSSGTVSELFQDAGDVLINGPLEVQPGRYGEGTQDYPALALIRVDENLRPGVYLGYGNSNDTSGLTENEIRTRNFDKLRRFTLELGGGAFRFVGFNGCPKTEFTDPEFPQIKYRVGLVAPAYKDLAYRFASNNNAWTTTEAHSLVALGDLTMGSGFDFDAETVVDDGERKTVGVRLRAGGVYSVSLSGRIRSSDAPAFGMIGLVVASNREGRLPSDRVDINTLGDVPFLDGPGHPPSGALRLHNSLKLFASQVVDTQLIHTEGDDAFIYDRDPKEVGRAWMQVGGTAMMAGQPGDSFVVANPTPYEITALDLLFCVQSLPYRGYLQSFFDRIAAGETNSGQTQT